MPLSQARSRSAPSAHHTHPKARIIPIMRKDPQPTNSVRCTTVLFGTKHRAYAPRLAPWHQHTHARTRPIDREKPDPKQARSDLRAVSHVASTSRSRLASRCQNNRRTHGFGATRRHLGSCLSFLSFSGLVWFFGPVRKVPDGLKNRGRPWVRAWWAWADLNGRPHAYQACALTS